MAIRQNFPARDEMTFFDVITRGLKRRPIRTGLTLLGISLGIAAVVALIGLSRGLVTSWTAGMKERGTDIVVHNMRGSLTPKPFPAATRDRIAHLPGVAATCMILVDLMSVETAELMIVSGREWDCFAWENLKLVSGRMPKDQNERAILLGTTAAIPTAIPRRVKPVRTGRRLRPRVITSKKVISCVPGKFCGIAIENNLAVLHLDRTRCARRNTHIMSDEDQRHATVEVERGD